MIAARAAWIGLSTSLALLTGCGAPSRTEAFSDVASTVEQRQHAQIHWNQGTADDRVVADQVRELLAPELTPEAAVQIALLNNRRLQAVYEDVGVAQAELVQAGLLHNPVLDADARFASGSGVNVELSLVQNFLDVFFIPMRKRVAAARLEAAKVRVAEAVIGTAGEVRCAMYRYEATSQEAAMRETVARATAAALELATRLHDAGNITDVDFAEHRSLHEQAKLDLAGSQAAVAEQRERLNGLMGLWGTDTAWTMPARLPDLPTEDDVADHIEQRAVEASLAISAAKHEVDAAAERLGIARPSDLYADVDAGVSAERDVDGQWVVGPAVSVPLPLLSQGQGAVLAVQSDLRRARANLFAQAVEVRSRARIAQARVTWTRDRTAYVKRTLIPLRHAIVEGLQEQYNGMLASPFRLIEAKRREIEAGAQYVQALATYWEARAARDEILLGGRPPDDVGRVRGSGDGVTSGGDE